MQERFRRFAGGAGYLLGSSWSFLCAVALVATWGLLGPTYHYSAMWQLVVNTGTSIVTYLMVFLIQNTQNRDMRAIHLKLDELRAVEDARTELVSLEERPDSELLELKEEFAKLNGGSAAGPSGDGDSPTAGPASRWAQAGYKQSRGMFAARDSGSEVSG
jgi:low affinity Fe/Cu permease